jgi:hypothetical protein
MSTPIGVLLIALALVVLAFGGAALAGVFKLAIFVLWVFGVVRSFQAHWVLGVISLLFAPAGLIVGAGSMLARRNIGDDIVGAFRR